MSPGRTRQVAPETAPDYDRTRIVERPDGFYWKRKGDATEYGPFDTLLAAVQDIQGNGSEALAPDETLREAEDEIGIADWVDPETGEPAEEGRPHIEDN